MGTSPPPNSNESCDASAESIIKEPGLGATQGQRAWYKILLLRRMRKELQASFDVCLKNAEGVAGDKLAKALASLKQAEIRTVIEECKTLGSDKAAEGTTDDEKRKQAVMRRAQKEACDEGE